MKKKTSGIKNKLRELFIAKRSHVLNMYCTAGYPEFDSLPRVLEALQECGADIIEIGIPYSDPVADGPAIQQSNTVALQNGMSLPVLLRQLAEMTPRVQVPVILMGYLNPIMQYGFGEFCRDASAAGVSALIIPDLPYYEYKKDYVRIMEGFELELIFLITPQTSVSRLDKIVSEDPAFIYAVSAPGTTGTSTAFGNQESYRQTIRTINERIPVLLGFGISNRGDFEQACQVANGAIIGSAFIRALKGHHSILADTRDFINEIIKPS
jgi:tryptophan synthase alpha chain